MTTNAEPSNPEIEGEVERINKADLIPLYDTAHKHRYELDSEDETDDYKAYVCVVPNCNLGYLVAKR